MIRKHKKFKSPRKAYDLTRINNENIIVARYGLKNKKEIWKARAKIDKMRKSAKKFVNSSPEEQHKLLEKIKSKGFNVKKIIDILALTEEDILKRRLQTIILKHGIATTPKGARQLITHKHIAIDGKINNIPSYIVDIEKEGKIIKVSKKIIDVKK